ncbi:Acg family FMN-binding oxidoreductase [Actinomadura scrupuli]|uniref:Acg family FMN-binding oxidoreductase n=1 Tax=Actinomadura scrupuli TaxID=559629 RepID=UPI003D97020C
MNLDRAGDGGGNAIAVTGEVARYAIEAAACSPSVRDARPWCFDTCSSGTCADVAVRLCEDAGARRRPADPEGRGMLIGCGAALCTLRLAVLRCGREPQVRVLPDPGRPGLLAEVRLGGPVTVTGEVCELCGQIRRRAGPPGPFPDGRQGALALSGLRDEARREGAALHVVSPGVRLALAALAEAGEREGGPDSRDATDPAGCDVGWRRDGGTGVVAVLTTEGDERRDWLAAGQALQRVLLRAGTAGLAAAFHLRTLAAPELRQFIGCRLFDGAHPQIMMRLGAARTGHGP